MISIPSGAQVLLATRPVDFRKGAHGLAALTAAMLGEDPFSGVVVVFQTKRADRVKILIWDASAGDRRRHAAFGGRVRCLFDGLDWTRVQTVWRIPTPTAAG